MMTTTSTGSPPSQDRTSGVRRTAAARARLVIGRVFPAMLSLVVLVGAWGLAIPVFGIKPYVLPPPSDVFIAAVDQAGFLATQTYYTGQGVVLGFLLSIAVAVPLAVAAQYIRYFDRFAYPMIITTQLLPKVALAPLFVIWFGYGMPSKLMMTFLIAFFPIFMDSLHGMRSLRREHLLLFRSMNASAWHELVKLRIPTALPNIFVGLKMGITFAVVGAIVGEFVGSDNGLGHQILLSAAALDTPLVFAALVWLTAMGLALYALVALAERIILGRRAIREWV